VPAEPIRLNVDLGTDPKIGIAGQIALAPDGRSLRLCGEAVDNDSARPILYVRHFDRLEAQMIPDTEGAQMPFFSPDGKWIAFFAEGQLRKVTADGGQVAVDHSGANPAWRMVGRRQHDRFTLPRAVLRVRHRADKRYRCSRS
jgi:Tol biopolymer transport system component